jgi:hypothetical protein
LTIFRLENARLDGGISRTERAEKIGRPARKNNPNLIPAVAAATRCATDKNGFIEVTDSLLFLR